MSNQIGLGIIESNDLPELTISGGGGIGEGGNAEFVINADQPVTEDTSINYTLRGSALQAKTTKSYWDGNYASRSKPSNCSGRY